MKLLFSLFFLTNAWAADQPSPVSTAGVGLATKAMEQLKTVVKDAIQPHGTPPAPAQSPTEDGVMVKNNGAALTPSDASVPPMQAPQQWGAPGAFSMGDKPEELAAKIRDPFARPKLLEEQARPRTELESIPLEEFKVIGVITGPSKKRAMVSANGKTYFVSQNVKIGTKNGIVLDILQDAVVVREKIINILGREENQDIQLKVEPEKQTGGT